MSRPALKMYQRLRTRTKKATTASPRMTAAGFQTSAGVAPRTTPMAASVCQMIRFIARLKAPSITVPTAYCGR